MVDRSDVEAIKARIDIVSLISRYLTLQKSGSRYKGHCPFHKDDTPSFYVDAEKGLWHCFGCGAGGDMFAFLMKIERISFPEALARLAAEAGVKLSSRKGEGERDKLYQINAQAAEYFAANLRHPRHGKRARDYLVSRGYDEAAWNRFGLGYALDTWDGLKARFAGRYGEAPLIELGLLVKGRGGRTYDRFRDRVIFPIFDLSGRPIAFGGRAFSGEPKYLNSPQTPLFDKGRQLYGLSWARDEIAANRTAILVEGYTDVLSLHSAGVKNAVGSMGTALTRGQAELLARFAAEVVIAYDRDAAGQAASGRGMVILHNAGLDVRVASLPEGDDPDSFVRREGKEGVAEVVAGAVPFHRFFLQSLLDRYDLESFKGKEEALEEARGFYQGLASLPLRQEVARLLGEILDLPPDAVARELARGRAIRPEASEEAVEGTVWNEQDTIIGLLLRGEARWEEVSRLAGPEDFSGLHRDLAEAIAEVGDPIDTSAVISRVDEEAVRLASKLVIAPVVFSDVNKALNDALRRLVRLPVIEEKLRALRVEMRKTQDKERIDELQRAYRALVMEKIARRADAKERRASRR